MILHECFPIKNSIGAWDDFIAKCISIHLFMALINDSNAYMLQNTFQHHRPVIKPSGLHHRLPSCAKLFAQIDVYIQIPSLLREAKTSVEAFSPGSAIFIKHFQQSTAHRVPKGANGDACWKCASVYLLESCDHWTLGSLELGCDYMWPKRVSHSYGTCRI